MQSHPLLPVIGSQGRAMRSMHSTLANKRWRVPNPCQHMVRKGGKVAKYWYGAVFIPSARTESVHDDRCSARQHGGGTWGDLSFAARLLCVRWGITELIGWDLDGVCQMHVIAVSEPSAFAQVTLLSLEMLENWVDRIASSTCPSLFVDIRTKFSYSVQRDLRYGSWEAVNIQM